MSRYILFLVNPKRRGRPFGRVNERWGGRIVRLPPRALGCYKRWKSLSFCELWNNPIPPLLLIRPYSILSLLCCLLVTNKYCRTWSSMINLWINSRTYQKYRILLSSRKKSDNYLELSKENVFRNMMLSHWQGFTWKFFIIWFHKILKLIFQRQLSCPRNMCTEYWIKPPIFTAFKFSYILTATIL